MWGTGLGVGNRGKMISSAYRNPLDLVPVGPLGREVSKRLDIWELLLWTGDIKLGLET